MTRSVAGFFGVVPTRGPPLVPSRMRRVRFASCASAGATAQAASAARKARLLSCIQAESGAQELLHRLDRRLVRRSVVDHVSAALDAAVIEVERLAGLRVEHDA